MGFNTNRVYRAAILSLFAVGRPAHVTAQCASSRLAKLDPTHPCEFMRISEVEKRDSTWLLFGKRVTLKVGGVDSVNTSKEVDRRSKIHIGYREQVDFPVGLGIGIEAFLRHDKNEVPMAVPGYSVVGEQKKQAELRAISPIDVRYRVDVLLRARMMLDSALAQSNEKEQLAKKSESARKKFVADLAEIRKGIEGLVQDSIKTGYGVGLVSTLQTTDPTFVTAKTAFEKAVGDLNKARANEFELQLKAAEATDASGLISKSDKQTLDRLLDIVKGQYQATAVVKSLKDSSNRVMLRVMSLVSHTPSEVLTSDLVSLERSFTAIDSLRPTTDLEALRSTLAKYVSAISTAIADLSRNDEHYVKGNPDYDAGVAALLPSTDIALFASNAEPGDRVIIRVTTIDLHEHRRVTDFAVDVVEYGITHGVLDSFLFLRRPIPKGLGAKLIRARAADYLGKTGLDRDLLSPVVDIPLRNSLTPTAGVTYGWTWHPRESHNQLRQWGRALHPGWGLNVSFPSYRTKQVTIIPPAADADTISSTGLEPTSNEIQKDLAIAFGGIASVFDGAVQLTGGRILSAPSHKWYWGLGLSFVGLTTAGKELYGKLTNPH